MSIGHPFTGYFCPNSMIVFDGDRIMVHRGGGINSDIDILPKGVSSSIKKVHKIHVYDRLLEALRVEFYNGNFATLMMHESRPDPINDEDLQEFRARCVMVHDL